MDNAVLIIPHNDRKLLFVWLIGVYGWVLLSSPADKQENGDGYQTKSWILTNISLQAVGSGRMEVQLIGPIIPSFTFFTELSAWKTRGLIRQASAESYMPQ